jgi:hypothetical protein
MQQIDGGPTLFHFVNAEHSVLANALVVGDKLDSIMLAKANVCKFVEVAVGYNRSDGIVTSKRVNSEGERSARPQVNASIPHYPDRPQPAEDPAAART